MGVLLAASVAGLILGGVLLVLGLRGRRIDDHPICRKCRFDLVGVWPGRETCPECGAGIAEARAVIDGRRARRPVAISLGCVLLLATALLAVGIGYQWYDQDGANRLKPVWILRFEARHRSPTHRGFAAIAELRRRMNNGELNRQVIDSLVSQSLAARLDEGSDWNPAWGDVFADAAAAGLVTAEQHASYLREIARPTMWLQPRIRSGDIPAHRIEWAPPSPGKDYRVGSADIGALRLEMIGVEIDGTPVPLVAPIAGAGVAEKEYWLPPGRVWTYSEVGPQPPEFPAITASPGRHTITVVWKVYASRRHGDDEVLAAWEARHSQEIEVRGPGELLVEQVVEADQRRAMREAFSVKLGMRNGGDGPPQLEGRIDSTGPTPVECAFRVDLEYRGVAFEASPGSTAGVYSSDRGGGSCLFSPQPTNVGAPRPGPGDVIRVVLTPDPGFAERLGILRMWGEPIVYEIKVQSGNP